MITVTDFKFQCKILCASQNINNTYVAISSEYIPTFMETTASSKSKGKTIVQKIKNIASSTINMIIISIKVHMFGCWKDGVCGFSKIQCYNYNIIDSSYLFLEINVNMNVEYEAHFAEKSTKGHRESQGQNPKTKLIFNSHHINSCNLYKN